ncbi:Phosphoethanolamine transferase EptA [hydrothermal vent metagenome]|uniref:Phosphoethanolamine transferase EptA n=1 Tax=hydrothermal vent metagenome TaxID=652676 RepID=A0A3B0ZN43_9ZZZZ
MLNEKKSQISVNMLVVLVALFLTVFGNVSFFRQTLIYYPLSYDNIAFIVSLTVLIFLITIMLFSIASWRYTVKPVLVAVLILSSAASYFMNTYNIIIDDAMIDNVLQTNLDEALDLVSVELFIYIILLGIVPSLLIYKIRIRHGSLKIELLSRASLFVISAIMVLLIIFMFSASYASFFREHKIVRLYSNPVFFIYSSAKYISTLFPSGVPKYTVVGKDAEIEELDNDRELVVFVVGETARYDRFSLNGYNKETNPLLKKEDVISFTNFWSCGTSTAISVPCMFSPQTRTSFDEDKSRYSDNLIDVLNYAGVNTLWLDNNSDSKGVAIRSEHIDFKSKKTNPICDVECRDIGMLANIQLYVDNQETGDIFIVLHQMGAHGPAYYKRYPAEFEKFTPTCKTNQLEKCTKEQLDNTYDNTILYTDYFLSEVINFLKNNSKFEASMIYASDHGESLGENGVYLHGLPYMVAPDEQKHVPFILWFGSGVDREEVDIETIKMSSSKKISHDYIFHTVLKLFEIESAIYDEKYNLL